MLDAPPPREAPVARWDEVLALFRLPRLVSTPVAVPGGWSHGLWRVETADGTYAIKEMVENPASWWSEQLDQAIAFELAAWRAATIAMAEPIAVAGSEDLPGRLGVGAMHLRYRCHRWVAGRRCTELGPSVERSQRVGAIVAELARLGVHGGSTREQLPWNALDAYEDTVAEALSQHRDWGPALDALAPWVESLRHEFVELKTRAEPMAIMHRDVDPKNTSLGPEGDVIFFDWDNAGPRLIASELLDAALSHAGGPIDAQELCVYATVDAYGRTGGPEINFHSAAPLCEGGFRWIMLNAWRALGHRGVPGDQEVFAASVVRALAPRWPDEMLKTTAWAERLSSRRG